MARACTICEHPERDSIDALIVCCESAPAIAARYGVSASAVYRHSKRHLSAALAAMQTAVAGAGLVEEPPMYRRG